MLIIQKRIEVSGKSKVPSGCPLIIVANHPTAFIDPILLCNLLDEPMYNMTRGDIFEKPWANRLLRSMNMFPVYRARDGYGTSRRNLQVFEYVLQKLREHKTIVIFVEGQHHLDIQLKSLQKGVGHIAQHAIEDVPELKDLKILPVGFNYRFGNQRWDDVSVVIGDPFDAKDYFQEKSEVVEDRSSAFMQRIEKELSKIVHHINHSADQPSFAAAKEIIRTERKYRLLPQIKQHERGTFLLEQKAVQHINALPDAERTTLQKQARDYFRTLRRLKVSDEAIANPNAKFSDLLLIIVGFIPAMIGYLAATPIRALADWLKKTQVKKQEFWTSIDLGVGVILGIIWYGGLSITAFLSGNPYVIASALALPLLGWLVCPYQEIARRYMLAKKAQKLTELGQVQTQREALKALLALG